MNQINTEVLAKITALANGSHANREQGLCLLEATAYVAGLPHSDHPSCTDPVLGAYGRAVNDFMTDDERMLLIEIVPMLIGTVDQAVSLRRSMFIVDATIRQLLPMTFEAIGLIGVASSLRSLAPIVDHASASAARSVAERAASEARSVAERAASAADSAARSVAERVASEARSVAERAASAADSAARSVAERAASAAWSAVSAAWSAVSAVSAASAASAARSVARMEVCKILVSIFKAAIEIA